MYQSQNNVNSYSNGYKGDSYSPEGHDRPGGTIYRISGNLFIVKQVGASMPKRYRGERGDITKFSEGCARRMRAYLRECEADYKIMVTLTYPADYPSNGKVVKEHLRRFIQEVARNEARNRKINRQAWIEERESIFWFLEFQNRGAPHFHLFSTFEICKKWCAKKWYEIVQSEDIRHLHAGTRVESLRSGRNGASAYANKYANKSIQKSVPEGYENVGRFWGVSGYRGRMAADTFVRSERATRPAIKTLENRIINIVKSALREKKAKILVSRDGCRVVIMHEPGDQRKLVCWIEALSSMTRHFANPFIDADLTGLGY